MLCLCSSSTPYSTGPGECQKHGGEGAETREQTDRQTDREETQVEERRVKVYLRELISRFYIKLFCQRLFQRQKSDGEERL